MRQPELLAEWEHEVRRLSDAQRLSRPALIDHMPELLDRLAQVVNPGHPAPDLHSLDEVTDAHVIERLAEGFDLNQIVAELAILRDCLVRRWESENLPPKAQGGIRELNRCIDRTLVQAVSRYTQVRDRTLHTLDRISTAALECRDLASLLGRLLEVLAEASEAIDSAAILLKDGDRLQVRAAVGLEEELLSGFSLRIGEGFAGTVAAEARPRHLTSASTDPIVLSPYIRARGLRALYGVPLIQDGEVIGVAHVGSGSVDRFSDEERRLIMAMSYRATTAITQHLLREQAEHRSRALRESEELFRATFNQAAVGLARFAPDGALLEVNQRFADLLGYSRDELPGMKYQDLLHPDELDDSRERLRRLEAGEIDAIFTEKRWRRKDGSALWSQVSVSLVRDPSGRPLYRLAGLNDITERKRSETALELLADAGAELSRSLDYKETLSRLTRLLVPRLADRCAIDMLREDGSIEELALYHVDPQFATRIKAYRDRHRREKNPVNDLLKKVLETGLAQRLDSRALEGTEGPVLRELIEALGLSSILIVPLAASGRILGALTLVTAESNRVYGEKDLELASELGRRAGLAIEQARLYEEEQKAVQVREDVLAIVSHDLRNPLGAIQLSASLLARKALSEGSPRVIQQLDTIRRSAERMDRLIRDLLDMANIQAGRLAVEPGLHDAVELLLEAFEMHEPPAKEKAVSLVRVVAEGPIRLRGDRERVLQVLSNLLGNAIKFCGPHDAITLGLDRLGEEVRFRVADTGPGIPEDELSHIFEPYWSARQHVKKGTGLGLFICKGIVEAQGGRIWVESRPGHGSTFYFTLPAA